MMNESDQIEVYAKHGDKLVVSVFSSDTLSIEFFEKGRKGCRPEVFLDEGGARVLRDILLEALPLSPKETITPPAVDTAKPHGAPGWEDVWDFEDVGVQRLRVAGGWLYMTCFTDEDTNTPLMSTVFVPAV